MFQYSVRYRRDERFDRIHRMTVIARDADEARRMVAARDPKYLHTTTSPKRGKAVVA